MESGYSKLSRHLLGSIVGGALLLSSSAALAACVKGDLIGDWKFYKHFYQSGSTFTGGTLCKLVLRNRNGKIKVLSGSNRFCRDLGTTTKDLITGGSFSIGSNCRIIGKIKTQTEVITVEDAQMEKVNKTTFSGIGTDDFSFGFNFTAVQQ